MPPTGGPTDTVGRGQVKIFDPSNLAAAPQILNLFAKQPRALARDASGARVFVSIFESGNQTTIVPESVVTVNGGLPPPNPPIDAGLPPAPRTSRQWRLQGLPMFRIVTWIYHWNPPSAELRARAGPPAPYPR